MFGGHEEEARIFEPSADFIGFVSKRPPIHRNSGGTQEAKDGERKIAF
jgi:hypothetical protein